MSHQHKSEKGATNLPVLKQALSIPPLVAQDSWFYNPRCKKSHSSEVLSMGGGSFPSSDYSSQTSSRSGSPDESRRQGAGRQFKLKTALLERFSPSCQEDDNGNDSDRSPNASPVSLKSRLLHRAEKTSSPMGTSAPVTTQNDEALNLQVHTTGAAASNSARTQAVEATSKAAGQSAERRYSPFESTTYKDIGSKSHANHTVSSSTSSSWSPLSSAASAGRLGMSPVAPGYLGMAFHPSVPSGRPPVHPALLHYQYTAMQQQFKTLQQLEAQRLQQR